MTTNKIVRASICFCLSRDALMSEKKSGDITEVLNRIGDEVNLTLDERKEERYFEDVVLLYSLLENLVKWLAYMKIMWEKAEHNIRDGEAQTTKNFAKKTTYGTALQWAYVMDVMDYPLFQRLLKLKKNRDDTLHQFWLYSPNRKPIEFRSELEELAKAANSLIGVFNKLTEDIGVDEVYEFFL